MFWLVAHLPDSQDIAAVARYERVDDACAVPLEPVTDVPFGGPEQIQFFEELDRMHRQFMRSRPHYCLHILATLPARQGQGAASALLRHVSDIADAQGRPIYLEAAPGSLPVYLKNGFTPAGAVLRIPAGTTGIQDSVVTAMIRETA
ncbi:hypothetical protein EXIGLDRAFT_429573 [Exidia glandulosa HHB12029]|nr:hypothetical protein EXIGLDRAFT_429573 [Exidia glandulosa HHB12029]